MDCMGGACAAQRRGAGHPVGIGRSAPAQIEGVDTHVKVARRPRPESLGERAWQGLLHPARGRIADISHERRRITSIALPLPRSS